MRSRDDILGSPLAITLQLPRGATHGLLGGSDGMECRVPPSMLKVSWMTLARGTKQLVVQEALRTIFREFSYLSWFTPITNTGGICRRGGDAYPLGFTLLHGSNDTSRLHSIFSTGISPFDTGRILLLEDG